MTTMTPPGDTAPPPPPAAPNPPPSATRPPQWQRSRSDRVIGGVAGGLADAFGVDPVLLRVLFAVASFFGGFGIVAYLVLWLALPEQGTPASTGVDRVGAWLQAHHIPLWLVGTVAVVLFWALFGGFSGWAFDGPWFPFAAIAGIVLLLIAVFRRGSGPSAVDRPGTAPRPDGAPDMTVSLAKPEAASSPASTETLETATLPTETLSAPGTSSTETIEAQPPTTAAPRPMATWFSEARDAGRRRRQRARPIALATLVATIGALAVVGIIDAVHGVALPVYGIVGGAAVLAGVTVGVALRRAAYSLLLLLIPPLVWVFAFAGTHTSLRDGAADRLIRPTTAAELQSDYRLAFGRLTLNLSDIDNNDGASMSGPRTVTLRVGAGAARVILPATSNVTVHNEVRLGAVVVDGQSAPEQNGGNGWRLDTTVEPTSSTGPPLTVVLQVTDGAAVIDHRG